MRLQQTRLPGAIVTLALALAACSAAPAVQHREHAASAVQQITVIGTNDLHGHVEMLPLFGGYMKILRMRDQRVVILVDGGDMFQGTLASNLQEGGPIVEAYNLLGYDAAAIGNHEFDFGPVGSDATASKPGQDPRGALKARAAAAEFPFLASNILSDEKPVDWPNVRPSVLVESKGVKVGIIGVSTFETPHVTLAANFEGLAMAPLVGAIAGQAKDLRARGAQVVVVAAHAGGICEDFDDPQDLSSCLQPQEIFDVAQALPPGSVDVIVAGHTHRGVAHEVNGIAIIESYSRGAAFGRVDLAIDVTDNVRVSKIHPPRSLCRDRDKQGPGCEAGDYEGIRVRPDQNIAVIAGAAADVAEALRSRDLGVELLHPILRSRETASALGNLFADLMLAAQPSADISITNGGGLRADLPKGPLHYGALFEAMPFDNRFAMVRLRGLTVRNLISENLRRDDGILSVAGMRVQAHCDEGELVINMSRADGKPIADDEQLLLATSDYIASGGNGLLGEARPAPESIAIDGGALIRDAMAKELTSRGPTLDASKPALYSADTPRIQYPGQRPVTCP